MSCDDSSLICRAAATMLFFLSLLLVPAWGYADLYSWTDENGVKHFSNDPPANHPGEFRTTDEYILNEKDHNADEIESPDPPKDSDDRQKAMLFSKRTGSGPKVNINLKYYDFVSVNVNDIIGVMWKKTPVKDDNTSYCANAHSHIEYHFHTAEENGTWNIDRVYTSVDVIFTMPRWADYQKASRDEQQKWDKFYKSLMEHENGHKDIAIEAAKEIENELLKLNSPSKQYSKKPLNPGHRGLLKIVGFNRSNMMKLRIMVLKPGLSFVDIGGIMGVSGSSMDPNGNVKGRGLNLFH